MGWTERDKCWDHIFTTNVVASVRSPHSRAAYKRAVNSLFVFWDCHPSFPFSPQLVAAWKADMQAKDYSAATINQRLSAVRRLGDQIDVSVRSIKGSARQARRVPKMATCEQIKEMLAIAKRGGLKGKRDSALLRILFYCGLTRTEAAVLDTDHLQKRSGKWFIVDLPGRFGHIRTVSLPASVRVSVSDWMNAAHIRTGCIFRPVDKRDHVWRKSITPESIKDIVKQYANDVGLKDFSPEDARRTFKLIEQGKQVFGSEFQ